MQKFSRFLVVVPILITLIAWILTNSLNIYSITFQRLEFLLNAIISSSATISGFILAAVTILVGATASPIMEEIRKKKGLQELRWRYTESLVFGLVVIVYFTFLGAITDKSNCITLDHLSFSAALLLGYLSSIISTCYYLLSIIGELYYDIPQKNGQASSPEGKFRFNSKNES